ncbi:TetR/AcrR family transcriptional regulator [Pseudomonas piscis]|uniref:TetR/AcrR family transcriptional regulator n=1 Tax=Pseudomonas piscis TaxID=2614538 RepID=UPI0031B5991A
MSDTHKATRSATVKKAPIDVLNKVLDDALKHGFAFRSLRAIAETAGISHRMLIYHFGSQEGLWAAIIDKVRVSETLLFEAEAERVDSPEALRALLTSFWQRYTSEQFLPFYQLHFETYSYALRHREECAGFLDGVVSTWVEMLAPLFVRAGFAAEAAQHRARMVLAATRGYHLDLITSGDRAAVEASAQAMVEVVCSPLRP